MVLGALVLLLVGVFGYAAAYYQGWIGGEQKSSDTAQVTETAPPLKPGEVTVNIYNATGRVGLAGRASQAIEARGFRIDTVADDPEKATVEHEADIRYGPDGSAAARLLRKTVPGAEFVRDDREGASVDLVLGDAFEELPELPTDDSATTEPEG